MSFIDTIKERAKQDLKTIVLPESEDIRTYKAAEQVLKEGFAKVIIIGSEEEVAANKADCDITGAVIVDPAKSDKTEAYVQKFAELRAKKGMTVEKAREIMLNQYTYYGVMMVKMLVSSFFLMNVPNCEFGNNGTFVFSDCGLNQNPNAEELAAIAKSSADSYRALTGDEPKVAMLSYSTMGSAKHDDVTKVEEATRIAKEENPDLALDGTLQLDAAIVPSVGEFKAPGSKVAGHANTLIFPNLDAGNIGYKLVQRLAKAEAYGPMTQGIAAPVNDLSRGCSAEDIVGVIAITAVQAQMQ